MEGVLLALLGAHAWAVGAILIRLGLQAGMRPVQGTLVSLLASFCLVGMLAVATDFQSLLSIPVGTLLWFGAVGILNFPLGRLFNFLSVDRLGVARATPVLGAAPLFAMLFSAIFLREIPNLPVLAGVVLIMGGISLIMSERGLMERHLLVGSGFALAGALAYGTAQVATRYGVTGMTSPLTTATISMLSGMVALMFMNVRDLGTAAKVQRKALFWVVLSGLFSSVGVLSLYWALSYVPVMIASPIGAINPVLTLIFARIFLGQHEKVTPRVVIGALLVLAGVVLVTVGPSLG